MSKANKFLEDIFGISQLSEMEHLSLHRGILQTKDYDDFIILSDSGEKLMEFNGA